MKQTRVHIARRLAEKLDIPEKDCLTLIDAYNEELREILLKGRDKVLIKGIGCLYSEVKLAGKEKVFGKEVEVGDRIKVKITTARTLENDFKKDDNSSPLMDIKLNL